MPAAEAPERANEPRGWCPPLDIQLVRSCSLPHSSAAKLHVPRRSCLRYGQERVRL